MIVRMTQFHLPNGRQTQTECDVPDDLRPQYDELRACGLRITCEVLQTGVVSIAAEHEEGDFLIELAENGPGKNEPPMAVERLLRRWNKTEFQAWLKESRYERQ